MDSYEAVQECILSGDDKRLQDICRTMLRDGKSPVDIIQNSLVPTMDIIGERLNRDDIFIPQVLLSAQTMQSAINLLRPIILQEQNSEPSGHQPPVVVGTVKGDIHSIGKNLSGLMMQSIGLRVIDLGVNVPTARFISAVRENNAAVVALSALLTTSMGAMRSTVRELQKEDFGHPLHIILGGGTITPSFARELGVEYALSMTDTARLAVTVTKNSLLESL